MKRQVWNLLVAEAITAAVVALGVARVALSQTTYTWKSGAAGDWSVATNWVGDVAPPSPGTGADSVTVNNAYDKVVTVSNAYHINALSLIGTIEFGAGADVTAASTPTHNAICRIRDGAKLTVNTSVAWVGYNSRLSINETGDGTGRLTINGNFLMGSTVAYASMVFIGGATTNTPVLNVTGNFIPMGYSLFKGGKVVVEGECDVRSGPILPGNYPARMSGGHWTVGSLSMRGGGSTVEGGLIMSSGSVMVVNGNVTIRSNGYDDGPSALSLRDSAQVTVNGSRTIAVGASTMSDRPGPGALRLFESARFHAPDSELRLGAGTYSDGTYVQAGGTATVKNVWVGYLTNPSHSNPAGQRGYGVFIISNGVFNCRDFNIRGGVNATVTAKGGTVAISNATLNILSTNETASIVLDGATWSFEGTGTETNGLEAPSLDLGAVSQGWTSNYALGTLEIRPGARLRLRDHSDNVTGDGGAPEAVYVTHLVLGAGATLDLNSLNLYYLTMENNGGTFLNGTPRGPSRKGMIISVR